MIGLNCKVVKKVATPPISTSIPPFQVYPLFLAKNFIPPQVTQFLEGPTPPLIVEGWGFQLWIYVLLPRIRSSNLANVPSILLCPAILLISNASKTDVICKIYKSLLIYKSSTELYTRFNNLLGCCIPFQILNKKEYIDVLDAFVQFLLTSLVNETCTCLCRQACR